MQEERFFLTLHRGYLPRSPALLRIRRVRDQQQVSAKKRLTYINSPPHLLLHNHTETCTKDSIRSVQKRQKCVHKEMIYKAWGVCFGCCVLLTLLFCCY